MTISKYLLTFALIFVVQTVFNVNSVPVLQEGRLLLKTGRTIMKFRKSSLQDEETLEKTRFVQETKRRSSFVPGPHPFAVLIGRAGFRLQSRSGLDCGRKARCFWNFGHSNDDRDYYGGGAISMTTQGRPGYFTPQQPLLNPGAVGAGFQGYYPDDDGDEDYVEVCDEYYDLYSDDYVEDCTTYPSSHYYKKEQIEEEMNQ